MKVCSPLPIQPVSIPEEEPTNPPPHQILETQSATLTNYEVLKHLESIHPTNPQSSTTTPSPAPMKSGNLETVVKELTDYLLLTPSTPLTLPSSYTESTIRNLLEALSGYELTKAELVMILNLRPDNAGVLDCVVEELDQRFSEGEQEAILGIVREVLGGVEVGEGDGEGDGEGAQGGER